MPLDLVSQVDLAGLRKVAAVRGLATNEVPLPLVSTLLGTILKCVV